MKNSGNVPNVQSMLWGVLEKYNVRDFRTLTVAMIEVRRNFSKCKPNIIDRLKWSNYFDKVEKAIKDNDYCYVRAINNL